MHKLQSSVTTPDIVPFHRKEITADILQHYSNLLKNVRFNNEGNHQYNLQLNSLALILDYLFHPQYTANHIYREDRKKETINLLLKGKDK